MKKWLLAIVITLALSIYQRMTGPTHPKRDEIVTLKDLPEDAIVQLHYRRFPTKDAYTTMDFCWKDSTWQAALPVQPVAGKLQYYISVNGKKYPAEEPLLIRFRNDVPAHILVPHILFMFASMLFAVYTFLLVIARKPYKKWLCGLRSLVGRLSLWHRPHGQ